MLTRLVDDPAVSEDYAQAEETVTEGVRILRVPFGSKHKYVARSRSGQLEQRVERSLQLLRLERRLHDVIQRQCGDAGYVGAQLSLLLGVPLVHRATRSGA